jgi:LuxR family maltose regulon positive regulatory protein
MAVALMGQPREALRALGPQLRRSKFATPQPPRRFLPRPKLVERLQDLARFDDKNPSITVVSAPVGTGKTTLTAALARQVEHASVAWCTLDDSDNDRDEFGLSILEAVLVGGSSDNVARAARTGRAAPDALKEALLIAGCGAPVLLVLDDCHRIAIDKRHETIQRLIGQAPAGLSIVLVTSQDLHLPTRGPARVGRLRTADLAFTDEDIANLFALEHLPISDGEVALIARWTDGAASAVALAACAYRDRRDRERIISSALRADATAHVALFDGIVERLSPELRSLALASSVVDPISGELASAICDLPNATSALAELARTDVFFDPVPGCSGWYRHRHPSRELLTAELEHEASDVSTLKSRAARWFAEAELHEQALETAVGGNDWNVVVEIVWPRWITAALDDSNPGLDSVPAMPDELAHGSRRTMLVAAALDLEHGELTDARARLDAARELDDGTGDEDDRDEAALFELLLSLRLARAATDAPAIDDAATALLDWLERTDVVEPLCADVDAVGLRARAEARLVAGDLDGAARLLEAVCSDSGGDGRDQQIANATASLALVTALTGRVRRAAALVDELGIARCTGLDTARGVRFLTCACCEYHADSVSLAQTAAAEARALLPHGVYRDVVLKLVQARLATSVGDGTAATRLRRHAETAAQPELLAIVCDALGLPVSTDGGPADDDAPAATHPYAIACAAVLEAARAYEAERPAEAWVALEQALALVERNAYHRVFLDAGVDVRPLLRDYITQARPFTQIAWQLLQRLPAERMDDAPPSVEILTDRELAVLRQLPTMKSNREIAAEMYFSVNTVKTHLKSVYRKLGVNRRRAAVEEARARSLL